jgi:hypothetical protein
MLPYSQNQIIEFYAEADESNPYPHTFYLQDLFNKLWKKI